MAQRTQSGLLQKVKLPLFGAYSNRGTNPDKDQRFVNFFPESRKVEQTDQTRVALVYRPGIKAYKKFASYEDAYRDWETDRKSTRLNSSHITRSRMPSSA